jgi:hypothetical protein
MSETTMVERLAKRWQEDPPLGKSAHATWEDYHRTMARWWLRAIAEEIEMVGGDEDMARDLRFEADR